MLNKKLEDAINSQINAEIYSSYLYYAMAIYFQSLSLDGFGKWLRIQAMEEMSHAQIFINYLNDRGARPIMTTIDGPANEWDNPVHAFEEVYKHECYVSSRINNLMDIALEIKDHASVNFLNWFIGEQVEEEASADEILQKLKLVENTKGGLFMLDKDLGARVFNIPVQLTGQF